MSHEILKQHACFGGTQGFYKHISQETQTPMEFAVFMPPAAKEHAVPAVYFLSGLTCSAENFTTKAGAQRFAAEHGVALIMPDTSPRNAGIEGEDDSYDIGTGAGFYVNATTSPWSKHYRMYSYVLSELPTHIAANFNVDPEKRSVFGHSMGGHGALVLAFRNPDRFRAVSAFSPICNPVAVPWGKKAFTKYLGSDEKTWADYDATLLSSTTQWRRPILVDQGLADDFLDRELKPAALEAACSKAGIPIEVKRRADYDHSYYFISSFVKDHIEHHARSFL